MTLDDADEQVTLMDAQVGPSRVVIYVRSDLRSLRCHIEPTRCGDCTHRHWPQR
jgi:hypothetical protein